MNVQEIRKLKSKIRMIRATLFIRNGLFPGKIYHVGYESKHWYVQLENGRKIICIKDKNKAVETAKSMAKKAYIGQVFIYKKDGSPQKVHTYVDEVRKEKERNRRQRERNQHWRRVVF